MEPLVMAILFLVLALVLAYASTKLSRKKFDRYKGVWFERGRRVSTIWGTAAYVLAVFSAVISGIEVLFPGTAESLPFVGGLLTATGGAVIGLMVAQVVLWTFYLIDRYLV